MFDTFSKYKTDKIVSGTIKNKMGLILPIENKNDIFLKGEIIELGSGITDTNLLEASKNKNWVCFTKEDVQILLNE